MDMYSNVLYAKECFAALSFLAHRVFMTDKYRPESCCIIGNYYSLKGQHEKSVLYFERALKLDKNYLSAWTLMGHEYVEMKNTPAAVDAYRRAIDINSCDYRAWYGLGQAYEMMGMHYYALHYFKKSVFLQPNDSRLWIAMARCYETDQLRMLDEAIKCYKRAVNGNDREAIALCQLAKLHHELGRSEEGRFTTKWIWKGWKMKTEKDPIWLKLCFFLLLTTRMLRDLKKQRCIVPVFWITMALDGKMGFFRVLGRVAATRNKWVAIWVFAAWPATFSFRLGLQEKEIAKSILQGMKITQSNFPSMDAEHFSP
ncbi:hypothetical protein CsatA_008694 [Cannabis sativa]